MEAGQPYELFWRLTLREISIVLDGVRNRLVSEHNDRMSLAWHVEALARQKKLPRLKELLHDAKPRRPQSAAMMEAITRGWLMEAAAIRRHNAKYGG